MSVSWIPRIGNEFAGYRLESLLGHGGMSIVYQAEHLQLERTVALKLLAPELSEDESFRERFVRESRVAASLDHPNVIPIYEAGDENDIFYIAMRYVHGSNVKSMLQREGPLDAERVVSIISQTASALTAAHEKGLVHRDVKPANILIASGYGPEESDHVYLSDFGIAKQRASKVLTKTGMFVGTADYASPEQIEGKELDARADIYSLGCVLYEALTGNQAYEKDSEVALMYAHLLEPPPSIHELRPDLPPEVDQVLAKAMAKSRDERYETPRQFSSALRDVLTPDRARTGEAPAPRASETVLAANPDATRASTTPAAPPAVEAPPPAAAPAEPAAAQAPPPGRPRGFSRGQLITAAAVLTALVLGSILAVVLLAGGDDSESSGTTGTTTGGSTPTTLLSALLPSDIAANCTISATPSEGALETENCTSPTDAPTSFPQSYTLSFYPTASALEGAYDDARGAVDIGDCGGTFGEKQWIHAATGNVGGRRVCGLDQENGDSVVAWTHEKRGSPDHVDMVGVARTSRRGANVFRSWWNAINDDVGKCRPRIPENVCHAAVRALGS